MQKKGMLTHTILPFGRNAIIAKVYRGPSWLDGHECIILDYAETSSMAHCIRDEIRQIGPHVSLGKVCTAPSMGRSHAMCRRYKR